MRPRLCHHRLDDFIQQQIEDAGRPVVAVNAASAAPRQLPEADLGCRLAIRLGGLGRGRQVLFQAQIFSS